jgi:enoyl-CoA hydratase/carnithine racemase
MAAAFQSLSHQTADHREAVAAFLEKRPPVFNG